MYDWDAWMERIEEVGDVHVSASCPRCLRPLPIFPHSNEYSLTGCNCGDDVTLTELLMAHDALDLLSGADLVAAVNEQVPDVGGT